MKKLSPRMRKLLLAVYFVLGGTFTFELTVEHVRENTNLYAVMTVLAIIFDVLFFKTLFSLARERALPGAVKKIGRAFSVLFRQLEKIIDKMSEPFLPKDKTFMEGKNERSFVFEVHNKQAANARRKLPKLSKTASKREKLRHAYTVYVFAKNKDISSSLTPNEVRCELDTTGENADIFENYNQVRYTKE